MKNQSQIQLKFIQVNLRKSPAALGETLTYIIHNNISIALIQEPPVNKNGEPYGLTNQFNIFYKHNFQLTRSLILTKKNVSCCLLTNHSTSDICTIETQINTKKLIIINYYMDKTIPIHEYIQVIEPTLETYETEQLILAGDANSHHQIWGSLNNNNRGVELANFLVAHELNIESQNIPTCTTIREELIITSIIDVTSTRKLLNALLQYRVDPYAISHTDHSLISWEVNNCTQPNTNNLNNSTRRYNHRKTDWEQFTLTINRKLEAVNISPETIKQSDAQHFVTLVDKYLDCIQQSCKTNMRQSAQISAKTVKLWWWTEDLSLLSTRLKAIKRSLKNAGTGRFRILKKKYEELAEEFKNIVRRNKQKKWQEYLKDTDLHNIWSLVKKVKQRNHNIETALVDTNGKEIVKDRRAEMIAKALYADQLAERMLTSNHSPTPFEMQITPSLMLTSFTPESVAPDLVIQASVMQTSMAQASTTQASLMQSSVTQASLMQSSVTQASLMQPSMTQASLIHASCKSILPQLMAEDTYSYQQTTPITLLNTEVLKTPTPETNSTDVQDNSSNRSNRRRSSRLLQTRQNIQKFTGSGHQAPVEYEVTSNEMSSIFTDINAKKCPGDDGLDPTICERLRLSHPETLRAIYNKSIELGKIPTAWKKSIVCPIHKVKKGQKENPANYRPIGLLSMIGKGLEKIINDRITYTIKRNNLISPNQYGFCPGRSTITALENLVKKSNEFKDKYKIVMILGFDFKGAFDNLSWKSIIKRIEEINIGEKYVRWFENYFEDRLYEIRFQGSKYLMQPTKGCVQGSPLSPTLWNLVINEYLLYQEKDNDSHTQAYADDLTIIIGKNTYQEVEEKITTLYRDLKIWAKKHGLELEPSKTEIMMIKGKPELLSEITLEEKRIQISQSLQILGVAVDSKFRWVNTVKRNCDKATNILNTLQLICNKGMGINNHLKLLLYNMVFIPTITYGCEIWAKAAEQKNTVKLLEKAQRRALQLITGSYKTTKLTDLQVITRSLPLQIIIMSKRYKYQSMQGEKTIIFDPKDRLIETNSYHFEFIAPWETPSINVHLPSNQNPNGTSLDPNDSIIIYTDGSKMDTGTGAAFAATKDGQIIAEKKILLSSYSSVFQAEMTAIQQALHWTLQQRELPKEVVIMSDSSAAIQAIKSQKNKNNISQVIKQQINEIQIKGTKMSLNWIRGHNNNTGNEYVDMLAKAAIGKRTKPMNTQIPRSTIKLAAKEWEKTQWPKIWENISTSLKKLLTNATDINNMNFDQLTKHTIWCITNHGPFAQELFRLKKQETDKCECGETQTGIHLLTQCPRFNNQRLTFLGTYQLSASEISHFLQDTEMVEKINKISKEICKQLYKNQNQN
jgi:ribonuclease HI